MATDRLQTLVHTAQFRRLLARKRRMCSVLSILMLLIYSLYFIAIAASPAWMGKALIATGVVSTGIYLTVACVLFSIVISGFYIWWANRFYDKPLRQMLRAGDDIEP